jgi:hypothetical protein
LKEDGKMDCLREEIEAILDECGVEESLRKIHAIRRLHDLITNKTPVAEVPCSVGLEGLLVEIERILYGIDKTELECSAGWWETSTGAEYGARKLEKIRNLLKEAD